MLASPTKSAPNRTTRRPLPGLTGPQCFDQTVQSEKRAGAHPVTQLSPKELPKWSGPTMTHK